MRSISSATQEHLDGQTTTLALCWRVRVERWQPKITGISSAGVVSTLTPHHLEKGDAAFVSGVFGVTNLNDQYWAVASVPGPNAIILNTSAVGAYTSGGEAKKALGFTDHDTNITIGNITYAAGDGLSASKVKAKVGGVTNLDITSIFKEGRVTHNDIIAGLYDNAHVDVIAVNYEDTAEQINVINGRIGEITLQDNGYTAEGRDYAHIIRAMKGDVYTMHCRAALGDAKCGVDTASATMQQAFVVTSAISRSHYKVEAITSVGGATASAGNPENTTFNSAVFQLGTILWYTGNNAGYGVEISDISATTTTTVNAGIRSLAMMPTTPVQGEVFVATQGCNKALETCRDRYDNVINFRGEPYIPTSNEVAKYGRNT